MNCTDSYVEPQKIQDVFVTIMDVSTCVQMSPEYNKKTFKGHLTNFIIQMHYQKCLGLDGGGGGGGGNHILKQSSLLSVSFCTFAGV